MFYHHKTYTERLYHEIGIGSWYNNESLGSKVVPQDQCESCAFNRASVLRQTFLIFLYEALCVRVGTWLSVRK